MAGRASLAFLGQEDVVLSNLPEVTYFIEKYDCQTQFAYRVDEVQFAGLYSAFGSEDYVVLPRSGDIVSNLYLKIFMPFLSGLPVYSSAGTLMLKYIELYIGSQLVERLWGEFIEMKMDIEIPQTKQGALASLTGKNTTGSLATYTIPIPFSCIKRGLPLCAFDDDVTVKIVWYPPSIWTSQISGFTQFNSTLHVEYVYLSEPEVNYIRQVPQVFLFEQCQRIQFFTPVGMNNSIICQTQFVNPVKEIFLVIQNSSAIGYDYTVDGKNDQLVNLGLNFNTTERIQPSIGVPIFLRNIQALEFHTRIPDRLFYMYSFSLDPESDAPSGHVNFSRIQNQVFTLNLNTGSDNRNIIFYATSYNFLDIKDGHATAMFPNFES